MSYYVLRLHKNENNIIDTKNVTETLNKLGLNSAVKQII